MLAIEQELLSDKLIPELDALWHGYYASTPAHTDIPPYDFNWPMFLQLQANDALLVLTARENGELVGTALYIVMEHLHHRGFRIAVCDTLAVSKDHRGKGIGKALLRASEDALKSHEVKLMINGYRTCYNTKPVFEDVGMQVWEHSYMKRIS